MAGIWWSSGSTELLLLPIELTQPFLIFLPRFWCNSSCQRSSCSHNCWSSITPVSSSSELGDGEEWWLLLCFLRFSFLCFSWSPSSLLLSLLFSSLDRLLLRLLSLCLLLLKALPLLLLVTIVPRRLLLHVKRGIFLAVSIPALPFPFASDWQRISSFEYQLQKIVLRKNRHMHSEGKLSLEFDGNSNVHFYSIAILTTLCH